MSEPLKPCPLCGSQMLTTYRPMQVASGTAKVVACDRCGARADREVWNRRTNGPATLAMVGKVQFSLDYLTNLGSPIDGGPPRDDDTETIWFTVKEARAFLAEREPAKPEDKP